MPSDLDGLDVLLPVVSRWFRAAFGTPTPPQRLGWPSVAAGRNTLIFAPTGSGKTLAAFLACLDHLWRNPERGRGVGVLYVSPLKALNQDISRNLEFPLRGILQAAEAEGQPLRPIIAAVRSGDTPQSERQRMVRKPPDILITTPESLHLLLTSRARETLRTVTHVIVDEIHALCANKRGVFLSLLLERLEALTPDGFLRIGLSATQRPLEEVARYLGGRRTVKVRGGPSRFEPRPVTVIDTGQRKDLDLAVIAPFAHAAAPRVGSVWPAIEERLLSLIATHRSTLIFTNNRRVAERLTTRINELSQDPLAEPPPADRSDADVQADPATREGPARSHHGSLSLEQRRSTEEALKAGELAAVVATASLELGIDMGAVDLVCQVESPGSVSRGLQRVGRAGHLVDGVSKGRLIAKMASDLLESAALCRKMAAGEVEELRVPTNCLDVLAQQVVACVAMDRWEVPALFDLVRRADPYRDLSAEAFEGVLKMVSGRFPTGAFRDLRARVSWDRVHNRLAPLPGTARLALVGGGTIPDTGHYPVYLGDGGPRLGELDEEFVLERRVGETFVLGTATWRIDSIDPHRVVVSRAEGHSAVMPFWRGEIAPRTAELGEAVGVLCRDVAEHRDDPDLLDRLRDVYRLEPAAARILRDHVARQIRVAGAVPDDRTVLVESFRDPAGETGLAVLSTFGGKLHQALKLVLQAEIRHRYGLSPASLHADEGVLFRLPQTDEPPLDLFAGLTAARAETLILEELGESALFGLRFRQNAGRALLMPRPDPAKRTPLWLQRLRARDLLQVVRKFPDFPVVVETFRECLEDDLDLPRLRSFLDRLESGAIRVVTRQGEVPSPFVSDLLFRFEHHFLYQWDEPKSGGPSAGRPAVDVDLLDGLLDPVTAARWIDPAAVGRVEGRLRGQGHPPRSTEETAEWLRRLGDLTLSELTGPMEGFVRELERDGRACRIDLPGTCDPLRYISAEEADLYLAAFPPGARAMEDGPTPALEAIVRRYLQNHALVGLGDLTARYPLDPATATDLIERWADAWGLVRVEPVEADDGPRWADPGNLNEVKRLSIALRRRESVAVSPEAFADFLVRWQGLHPETRRQGSAAVALALEQLQGFAAPVGLWESEILPGRVRDYRPAWLEEALASGEWFWQGAEGRSEPRVAFLAREFPAHAPEADAPPVESEESVPLLELLGRLGASFASDLARISGLAPSRVRLALDQLARHGLVTNDRFDPIRPGAEAQREALAAASHRAAPRLGRSRSSFRRPASSRPEGRWSLIPRAEPGDSPASVLLAWADVLLRRYGVVTRETAALDLWAPAWRDLATCLARAELRGDVRRGYFVEGLSGVQYATDEAAESLARRSTPTHPGAPDAPLLMSTLDPANLYGSGAPFDVELLEGGTARLPRTAANHIVLCGGRPVLIIESSGRRLTGLSSASEAELRAAIGLLPALARPPRRVLKVESYNSAATLASPAAPWLAAVGFVRDYPGMAFYAGW